MALTWASLCKQTNFTFFYKKNILISWRYQIHPTSAPTQYPKDTIDAHNQNKMKEEEKVPPQ
jgi:hypothetical protein